MTHIGRTAASRNLLKNSNAARRKAKLTRQRLSRACAAISFGSAALMAIRARAAVITYTYQSTTAADNWSNLSEWNNAPPTGGPTGIGNIAVNGSTTNGSETTTLNTAGIVIGQVYNNRNGSRNWTIAADANFDPITMNNTGGSESFLVATGDTNAAMGGTGSGGFNFLSSILMATSLDIGDTSNTNGSCSVVIGTTNSTSINVASSVTSGQLTLDLRADYGTVVTSSQNITINSAIGNVTSGTSSIQIVDLSNAAGSTGGTETLAGAIGGVAGTASNVSISDQSTSVRGMVISGALGASVTGVQEDSTTSTLTLSNANGNYTGNTTITSGILATTTAATMNLGNVTIGGSGTNGNLSFNGPANAVYTITGLQDGSGATAASQVITNNSGSNTATLTYTSGTTEYDGVITNAAHALALTVTSGNLTLGGTDAYTGATTIASAGSLQLGNGGTTGNLSTSSSITDNGKFIIDNSGSITQGSNFSSAAITGIGSFTQAGGGTTTFNVANSYSGATNVNNGTLTLSNGSSTNLIASSSSINIASAGTLNVTGLSGGGITLSAGKAITGTGTVSGNVTTVSTSAITPGTVSGGGGNGALTVGNLTLGNGTVVNFGITGTGTTNNGYIDDLGVLNLPSSGTVTIKLFQQGSSLPFAAAGNYSLFEYGSSVNAPNGPDGNGTLDPYFSTSVTGFTGNFTEANIGGNNYVVLTLTASGTVASWTNTDATGNWSDPLNWSGNATPMNPGDSATFGTAGGGGNVTLDMNETVGAVIFNSAASYLISGSGTTLTLNNNGGGATIADFLGNHTISVPLSITDAAGLTVTPNANTTLTLSGIISGNNSQAITMNGAGTLVLSGNNTYGPAAGSVGTTLSGGGVLQVASNNALGAGDLSIPISGTLQAGGNVSIANNVLVGAAATIDSQANTFVLSGNVTGIAASLTKIGSGTLILSSANNTYGGGTTVNAGVLSVASDGASAGAASPLGTVPSAATADNIILNGGDLFGNGTFTLNANRGIGLGPIVGSTGGTGIIDAAAGQTLTIAGVIASAGNTGANNLVINGAGGTGTVVLNGGNNTYTGTTYVSGGTLQLGNSTAIANSTLNLNSPNGNLSFGSLTSATFGALNGNQPLALTSSGGNVALTISGIASSNFSGNLSGGGDLTVSASTQTTTLSNANVTGNITVGAGGVTNATGQLTINGGSFGSATSNLFINSNGVVGFIMKGGNATFGNVYLATSGANQTNAGGEILGGNATFGAIQIGAGAGSPNSANTNHAGAFTINDPSGTVALGNVIVERDETALTTGLIIDAGNVTATTMLVADTSSGTADLNMSGGSLTIGNSTSNGAFVLGDAGEAGNLVISGGSLTYLGTDGLLIGNNTTGTATNVATINGNSSVVTLTAVTLNNPSNTGTTTDTLTVNTGATVYLGNATAGSSTVGLVLNAPGGGNVSFNFGNATIGAIGNWTSSAPITLVTGGTTNFRTANSTGSPFNIGLSGTLSGNGGLAVSGNGTLTVSGANTYAGLTTLSSGTLNINGEGAVGGANYTGMKFNGGTLQYATSVSNGTGDISGNSTGGAEPVTIGPNGGTIDTDGNAITYAHTIGGNGTGALTVTDSNAAPGNLTLLAAATYTGNTTITSTATLQLGNGTVGFDGTITSSAAIIDNGTLIYNRGGNFTSAVPISGSGAVIKTGPGSQTLTANNSYSGGTTINAGALNVANTTGSGTGSGNVTLAGGTLAGSGNISGNVNVNGGTVAPGAAGTTLTVGSLNYNSGNFGFSFNGNTSSEISSGNVTFNASLSSSNFLFSGTGTLLGGDQETLINSANPITNVSDAAGISIIVGRETLTTAAINGNDTLVLNVMGNPANLIWAGNATGVGGTGGDGTTWNNTQNNGGNNWENTGNSSYDYFYDQDNVTFNGQGTPNYNVTLTTVNSPASVTVNTANTYTFGGSGSIGGIGNLTVVAGTLQLNTSNTYSGLTTVSANGTLSLAGTIGSGTGTAISNAGTFNESSNGVIAGASSLLTTGNTTLAGVNSYTGSTILSSGTLSLTGTIGSGGGTAITSAATFNESGAGVIAGTSSLAVTGGTTTLAGTNTYTGGTTVTGGTLSVSTEANLGAVPANVDPAHLVVNGGTLATTGNMSLSANRGVELGSGNGTFTPSSGTTLTVAGVVANVPTQTGALLLNGPGTVTLQGNNTFSGGEVVTNGGTLSIATNANLGAVPGSVTPASITLNNGTLQVTATTAFEAPTISGNRGITLGSLGGTIQVTGNGTGAFGSAETAVQYDGIIAGSGNLTITGGSGTNSSTAPYLLELGGTANQTTYNTYTGNTTINNATLAFQNVAGNLGATNLLPSTTVLNLINNGWFVMNSGTAKQTVAGLTGDSTAVVDNASGTSASTLTIAPAAGTSYTFNGNISGNTTFLGKTGNASEMSVTINGTGNGTEVFTGTNTYAGLTLISAGTLQYQNAAAMSASSQITMGNNTTVQLRADGNTTFTTSTFNPSGGTTITIDVGAISTGSANTLALNSTGNIGVGGGNNTTMTWNVTGNNTDQLTVAGGILVYSNDTCALVLNPTTAALTIASNVNTAGTSAIGALNLSGTSINNVFSGSITNAAGGTVSVTKSNSSTWTLSGDNTYTGNTAINAGTLFANNATSSLGSGAVNVNGGLLSGNGSITNGLTVNGGGSIGAGGSPGAYGLLNTAAQTWNGNGTYVWKLGGNSSIGAGGAGRGTGASGVLGGASGPGNGNDEGVNWDLLNVTTGGLNLSNLIPSSPFYIAPVGAITSSGSSYSWVILQSSGDNSITLPGGYSPGNISTSTVGSDLTNGNSNGIFVLNTNNFTDGGNPVSASSFTLEAVNFASTEDLVLDYTYSAAPEPGTAMLVLAGGLPMLMARRRRKNASTAK